MLEEWSGDDVDELFELLDAQLGDLGIDIKFDKKPTAAAEVEGPEDDEDEEDLDDEEDDEDDDDLDDEEDDEEEADDD